MFALIEYWNGGYKGRVLGIYTTKEAAKAAMPMDYTATLNSATTSSARTS